jgi:2-polyprenyl-6-methoxyphenol hydroxylase-like FAD-dependent oxidoreductase
MQESTKGTNPDDSEATPQNEILYGNRVVGCTWDERTQRWNIQIDRNKCFQTSIIVAADGAKSFLRTDVLQIPMDGQATIQNLINVHFRVSEETEKRIPKAMLYTVFSKNALAMIVRHGPGEYVMQIPYFDPYQTPEQDFSMAKVKEMVGAALGGEEDDHDLDFDIHSIRPWSMGSLVARDYFSKKGIFLAGDAAHVFPPAGGFGMNTGLQDVFSLAWRLSLLHENAAETTHWGTSGPFSIQEVGSLYQQERQPVARNNAALSVRNYQRVLGVMQACYLNHQHPTALIAALDATAPLVPMSTRQRAFQTLLQAALLPLGQLKNSPNGLFATRVKRNLQRLLGAGQGLPLLFPQHELDFSYGDKEGESSWHNDHWKNDSKALDKHLSVGTLFPHMSARVSADSIRKFPRLAQSESTKTPSSSSDIYKLVSTRDLATQLSSARSPCVFCVGEILISDHPTEEKSGELETLKKDLEERLEISCETVRIVVVSNAMSESLVKHDTNDSNPCTMFVDKNEWDDIKLDDDLASKSKLLVVIRPDGHVAAISSRNDAINIFQPTRKTLFIQ